MRSYEFLVEVKITKHYENEYKIDKESYGVNLPDGRTLKLRFFNPPSALGNTLEISFSVDGSHGITNKGDQYNIFSTVLYLIQKYIHKHILPDDEYIQYTADANSISRVMIYRRGTTIISEILGGEWEPLEPQKQGSEIFFIWERVNEDEKMDPKKSPFLMNEFKNPDEETIKKYNNYTKVTPYTFEYTLSNGKLLELYFLKRKDYYYDAIVLNIIFSIDNRFELTKMRGAFEALNVVRTILNNELLNQITPDINYIKITADIDEPSRIEFYKKYAVPLISNLIKENWKFKGTSNDLHEIEFYWERKKQSLNEGLDLNKTHKIISKFLSFAKQQLQLEDSPKLHLITNKDHSIEQSSFGGYANGHIYLTICNRHINDCLRSLAHELVHFKQDLEGRIKKDSGKDGSPEENEANAMAAVILRKWGKRYPKLFGLEAIEQRN